MPGKLKPTKPIYKDTVVIGNGPSAISLSYMLSGNVAYYSGRSDDDLLHARMSQNPDTPVVLQDLKELSEGLDGRSNNPVSLLFDALAHPDADLGVENPPLVSWKQRSDLAIDHVVLGPDLPGGAWRMMDNDVLTVSLGSWMELPSLKMSEWNAMAAAKDSDSKKTVSTQVSADLGSRVNVALVAEYYKNYVQIMGLEDNFVNRARVTGVRKITNCPSQMLNNNNCCGSNSKSSMTGKSLPNINSSWKTNDSWRKSGAAAAATAYEDQLFDFSDEFDDDLHSSPMTSSSSTSVSGLVSGGGGEVAHRSWQQSGDSISTTSGSGGGFRISTPCPSSPSSSSTSAASSFPEEDEIDHLVGVSSGGVPMSSGGVTISGNEEEEEEEEEVLSVCECPVGNGVTCRHVANVAPGDALSATPMGQYMRQQAFQNANVKCCLHAHDVCNETAGAINYCSWNPIVNPGLFTEGRSVSLANSPNPVNSGLQRPAFERSQSWQPAAEAAENISSSSNRQCPVVRDGLRNKGYMWEVSGEVYDAEGKVKGDFRYVAHNVVMAVGSSRPNSLAIPGEDLPFVLHSLKELEAEISSFSGKAESCCKDPVMIVGAGLSSADAVIAALENDLEVLHVFRRGAKDKGLIFKNLPPKLYPEYHKVHRMMAAGGSQTMKYRAMEKQHLIEIFPDKRVKFHGEGTTAKTVKVSYVVVLIGGRPNLDFFDDDDEADDDLVVDRNSLGIVPEAAVSKNNPVDINIFTHESVKHAGLYAMGPLVGDNFVRFLQGGALAITANILKCKNQRQ